MPSTLLPGLRAAYAGGLGAARGGRYLGSRQGLGAACSRCSGPFPGLLPVSVVRY